MTGLTDKLLATLEKRGIDPEVISRLGWTSVASNDGEVVEIPYYRGDKVVGRKFRTFGATKKFWQEEGSEQCLYNLNVLEGLSDTTPIVITEGEADCVIALQCGHVAVSVPNGALLTPAPLEGSVKYNYLKDIPEQARVIILAVDADQAGKVLLHDLTLRLGAYRCKWVPYPKGCKDLNDTYMRFKRAGVDECFRRAEWVAIEGIYRMSQLAPVPDYPTTPCGVDGLNEHYLLRQGDLTVISGMPSHGKTTLVDEIACNMAKLHGWKVCFGSFEQSPKTDHLRYLRTYFLGKPAHLLPENSEKLAEADKWIDENFMFIVPDFDNQKEPVSVDWAIEKAAAAVIRHGVQLVIIDPYNELDHERGRGETLTEYTGQAIKKFKRFAKKHLVHVIIIAHPAKLDRNQDGKYAIPSLYDISDSAHWYNKPDLGMVIFRNEVMVNIVRVQKCRYEGKIGKIGDVYLKYDDYRGQFVHLNNEELLKHTICYYANHPHMVPPQNIIADVQQFQAEKGLQRTEAKHPAKKKFTKRLPTPPPDPEPLPPPIPL